MLRFLTLLALAAPLLLAATPGRAAQATAQAHLGSAAREISSDAGIDTLSLKIGDLQRLEDCAQRTASVDPLTATKHAVRVGERR